MMDATLARLNDCILKAPGLTMERSDWLTAKLTAQSIKVVGFQFTPRCTAVVAVDECDRIFALNGIANALIDQMHWQPFTNLVVDDSRQSRALISYLTAIGVAIAESEPA